MPRTKKGSNVSKTNISEIDTTILKNTSSNTGTIITEKDSKTIKSDNKKKKTNNYVLGKIMPTDIPRKIHIVKRGESIQSIAGLYSVPVMKLIKLNGTQEVSVGQRIYIN